MSTANNSEALRDLLFEVLHGLKDGKIDVETAKAMSGVASEIIKTAKLEVDYMVKTGKTRRVEYIESGKIEGMTPPRLKGNFCD